MYINLVKRVWTRMNDETMVWSSEIVFFRQIFKILSQTSLISGQFYEFSEPSGKWPWKVIEGHFHIFKKFPIPTKRFIFMRYFHLEPPIPYKNDVNDPWTVNYLFQKPWNQQYHIGNSCVNQYIALQCAKEQTSL